MKKYLVLLVLAVLSFTATYSATSYAYPPGGILGRGSWQGYFTGNYSGYGDNVFPTWYDNCGAGCWEAMPNTINSADSFIGFIRSYMNSGNYQLMAGASFIVHTMLGWWSWNNQGVPAPEWMIQQWEGMVRTAEGRGHVVWRTGFWFNTNSAYQPWIGDDAFFDEGYWRNDPAIVFMDANGVGTYGIRWQCGNPILQEGDITLEQPWSVTGSTNVSDSDSAPAGNITTTAGDTLTFRHAMYNYGPATSTTDIASYGNTDPPAMTGQYFNNTTLSGSPVMTVSTPSGGFYYNWGSGSPGGGVGVDNFSVRWTATDNFPAGNYRFFTYTDDGVRLYVDGTLVINDWNGHPETTNTGTIALTAGNHTITMEYFESVGLASAGMYYQAYVKDLSLGQTLGAGVTYNTTETVPVPAGATPGTKICRRIWYNWRNSWANTQLNKFTAAAEFGPPACATVVGSYNLVPAITAEIGGGFNADNIAEAGETLFLRYYIANTTATASPSVNCNIVGLTRNGSYSVPTPYDSTSDAGFSLSSTCPRSFAGSSNTMIQTEGINTNLFVNKTICRSLFVNPADPTGTNRGTEICVRIVTKPFERIFGGDISAGSGFMNAAGSCVNNSAAGIVGWNRRTVLVPNWAAAGTQYGAYALSMIFDTATAENGGMAQAPVGLSFRNNVTSSATGNFGGNFASLPCAQDYYGTLPSSGTTALGATANVSTLASGTYTRTGNLNLGGGAATLPAGKRVTIYVDGDLFLANSISYGGTWTSTDTPMFRAIVRGNIFVDNDVTRLDGLFVAQPNGAAGGVFHTCGTAGAPFTPVAVDGSLRGTCGITQLTVNGAVIAKEIRLLRTQGSQYASTGSAEPSTSANIAEVFNYNPSIWMVQPPLSSGSSTFDAITTLPPVL